MGKINETKSWLSKSINKIGKLYQNSSRTKDIPNNKIWDEREKITTDTTKRIIKEYYKGSRIQNRYTDMSYFYTLITNSQKEKSKQYHL